MQLSNREDRPGDSDQEPSNGAQEDWEDVTDVEDDSQREVTGSIASGGSVSTSTVSVRKKRRRVQTKAIVSASPAPSRTQSLKGRKKTPLVKGEELQEAFTVGARFTASYAFDVFRRSIEKMRRPLSWFLFVYMLAWLASRVTPAVRTALSPLCIIPGISSSWVCIPVQPRPLVNFEKLAHIQGTAFDKLVEEAAGGSELSIGVLQAEMATRDLSIVVRYSDLKSKESIADSLETIATDAKRTGRGLSKLDAKVLGAIDDVMALNNYAKAAIGNAHKKAPSLFLQAVSPFNLGPTAGEIIAEAFTLAMDESEQTIRKLRLEAEVSLQNLEQLDTDIEILHDMVVREDKQTTTEKDELLAQLWTRWGGNKKSVRTYEDHLALLNSLGEHRKQANAHVQAALRTLRTMSDDLEVLRERVAAPGLLEGKVPLHVHMEAIQNGLERLQEGRMASRGRRLEYDETVRLMLE